MTITSSKTSSKKRIMTNSPYTYSEESITNLLSDLPTKIDESPVQICQEVDTALFQTAIEIGFRAPRIALYSPMAAAILEYLDRTTPQFCKSDFCARHLNQALKNAYPELWNAIFSKVTTDPNLIALNKNRRKNTSDRGT